MKEQGVFWKCWLAWLIVSMLSVTLLEVLRLAVAAPFSWSDMAGRWAFIAGVLLIARWVQPRLTDESLCVWPWTSFPIIGIGLGVGLVYLMYRSTWAAWGLLGVWYILLLGLDKTLTEKQPQWGQMVIHGVLALISGFIPTAIAQIESSFADEEFFVVLQALVLSLLWVLVLAARRLMARWEHRLTRWGLSFDRRWVALTGILLVCAGLWGTVHSYQGSFYSTSVPTYAGISPDRPFICGEVQPDPQTFDGEDVFRRLLAQLEANPDKESPVYGMLALGTGDWRWAQAFRTSILDEAAQERFTGPAHSVKSIQYEAAIRAYYLPRVRESFPGLFSESDLLQLQGWFAEINRRAWTTEWVDWMYALAFSKWPEGPYENQENGAGLLALLESEGLAAPELSMDNRGYLEQNQRGWLARFRNTDDAFCYQLEWINNAYFQSLYTGMASETNKQLSFEWLLLQALPDGAPLRYNHPVLLSLAGTAYLGAYLLHDPRYMWLAGRALTRSETQGGYLFVQPGIEQPIALTGHSPTQGSCLLYGDSGLPNQVGPLAPDKIVFRDGWTEDATYLLLNLRFTGWHRYKATNTVTLIYKNGPLVADVLDGESFGWLPTGRSLFRDKRIPRENLNGLQIEHTGMSAVLYSLTGIGSPWAQDPPHYAEVLAFHTGEELDWSHTRLVNWHGWQHDRWVYFYHDRGPIVVMDEAEGPWDSQAALIWHLSGEGTVMGQHVQLHVGGQPLEALFLPLNSVQPLIAIDRDDGELRVQYDANYGHLRLVTLFLPGHWVGAEVQFDTDESILHLRQPGAKASLRMHLGE